jgi:hypothetical protein
MKQKMLWTGERARVELDEVGKRGKRLRNRIFNKKKSF